MIKVDESVMNFEQRQRLGVLIKEIRKDISQREFAKRYLDCSYAALRSWEEGESVPGLENLEMIAELKSWSLAQLLTYVRDDTSSHISYDELVAIVNSLPQSEKLKLAQTILASLEVT